MPNVRRSVASIVVLFTASAIGAGCTAGAAPGEADVDVTLDGEGVAPQATVVGGAAKEIAAPQIGVGVVHASLVTRGVLTGRLRCAGAGASGDLRHVSVSVPGVASGSTRNDGTFRLTGAFPVGSSVTLKVTYDGTIGTGAPSSHLEVMDELHDARGEQAAHPATTTATAIDLGTVTLSSVDCELWRIGANVLDDYHLVNAASPPAGGLRILRWSEVDWTTPYTFYDYINVANSFLRQYPNVAAREETIFHEFGHTVRHAADGDEGHWNWDDFRWAYGREHDGQAVYNVQYTFNEGWAEYWAAVRSPIKGKYTTTLGPGFRDWNELLVANRLLDLRASAGGNAAADKIMVDVLRENPGAIHSLHEYETKLAAKMGAAAPPAPASCPPGYHDDGATCRRDAVIRSKPSYGRGVGVTPNACGAGHDLDAGLCYPACASGYHGVGPVCWGTCPAGYHDDGATCRRDASIIASDNHACPGWDICGLTFAKGCSTCPAGYSNDGCTCRRDADIFGKPSYGRGAGTVPTACVPGEDYDAGLCYHACASGYHGVGPVCWGACPAGFVDDGATCRKPESILVKY